MFLIDMKFISKLLEIFFAGIFIIFRSSSSTFHDFTILSFSKVKKWRIESSKLEPIEVTVSEISKVVNCSGSLKHLGNNHEVHRSIKRKHFGSSRNHLKNIALGLETLISHFGIIKTPWYPLKTWENKKLPKERLICFPYWRPLGALLKASGKWSKTFHKRREAQQLDV